MPDSQTNFATNINPIVSGSRDSVGSGAFGGKRTSDSGGASFSAELDRANTRQSWDNPPERSSAKRAPKPGDAPPSGPSDKSRASSSEKQDKADVNQASADPAPSKKTNEPGSTVKAAEAEKAGTEADLSVSAGLVKNDVQSELAAGQAADSLTDTLQLNAVSDTASSSSLLSVPENPDQVPAVVLPAPEVAETSVLNNVKDSALLADSERAQSFTDRLPSALPSTSNTPTDVKVTPSSIKQTPIHENAVDATLLASNKQVKTALPGTGSQPINSQLQLAAAPAAQMFKVGETVSPSALANRFRSASVTDTSAAGSAVSIDPSLEGVEPVPGAALLNRGPLTPEKGSLEPTALRIGDVAVELTSTAAHTLNGNAARAVHPHAETASPYLPLADDAALAVEIDESLLQSGMPLDANQGRNNVAMAGAVGNLAEIMSKAGADQSVDNMLSAGASGTVTAPMLSRVDSTSAQIGSAPLNVPLMAGTAADSLAGNVRWMVNEGVQTASVNVTPSGMGPISVKIGIENEQMNVSIVATQHNTRDALEALLPRLREQLLAQGHDSVKVEVSDGRSEQSRGSSGQQFAQERQSAGDNQASGQGFRQSEQSKGDASQTYDENRHPSGERVLSESERRQMDQIQGFAPDGKAGERSVRYGYDLYV